MDVAAFDVLRNLVLTLVPGNAVAVTVVVALPNLTWKARMEERTKEPELVSWLTGHTPSAFEPGRRAAHFSLLSLMAQFASEM